MLYKKKWTLGLERKEDRLALLPLIGGPGSAPRCTTGAGISSLLSQIVEGEKQGGLATEDKVDRPGKKYQ